SQNLNAIGIHAASHDPAVPEHGHGCPREIADRHDLLPQAVVGSPASIVVQRGDIQTVTSAGIDEGVPQSPELRGLGIVRFVGKILEYQPWGWGLHVLPNP